MNKIALMLTAAVTLAVPLLHRAQSAEVSADFFYQSLEPYGDWVETKNYGYAWTPRDVDRDWRPYTRGNWAYTDAGWTFVSEEPYGAITYHYGRWAFADNVGWLWVPDTEWGPAWVSWRRSEKHIGWAPLPPEAEFTHSVGIQSWADSYYDIGPTSYSFVSTREFGSPRLASVILAPRENVTIMRETRNITNISYRNSYVYNSGPEYEVVTRESAAPIRRLRLERRDDISMDGRRWRAEDFRSRVEGDSLRIAAPEVRYSRDTAPQRVTRRLDEVRVDRGWTNAPQANELRATIRREAPQRPQALPEQPRFDRARVERTALQREESRAGAPATAAKSDAAPGAEPTRSPQTRGSAPNVSAENGAPNRNVADPRRPGAAVAPEDPSRPPGRADTRPGRDGAPAVTAEPGTITKNPGKTPADAASPGRTTAPGDRPAASTERPMRDGAAGAAATDAAEARAGRNQKPGDPAGRNPREGALGEATPAGPGARGTRGADATATDAKTERTGRGSVDLVPDSSRPERGRGKAAPSEEQPGSAERIRKGGESPGASAAPDRKGGRPESEPAENPRAGKPERGSRPEAATRAERPEASAKPERPEASQRSERPEAVARPDRNPRADAEPKAERPQRESAPRADAGDEKRGGARERPAAPAAREPAGGERPGRPETRAEVRPEAAPARPGKPEAGKGDKARGAKADGDTEKKKDQ